jgi:hypothetical protein
MNKSVEVTLRFQTPQEVATFTEAMSIALDQTEDLVEGDSEEMIYAAEMNELWEAIWACLRWQGFERYYGPDKDKQGRLMYKGEVIEYKREKKIEPVLERRPTGWSWVNAT